MAVRKITTSLELDGEKEFKKQLSSVNGELRNLKSDLALTTEEFKGNANSMEALTAKSKILNREIEQQKEKVGALERAVKESSEVYGDADSRTDKYRQSLNRAKTDLIKMQRELQDTDKYMEEAKRSTDKTAKSIDKFGKEVKDAGGDLDNLQGFDFGGLLDGLESIKGLGAAAAIGATAGAVKSVADGILEVEEATREYRKIMGTLETSSQAAGYTADQTKEAYERLYGVLGDTQTAATTVANLQAIGLSHEDLMLVIDSATGAWAKYGDSIPIDGLAESINETIKAGEVTGTFADVLNWGTQEGETFGVQLKQNTKANEEYNKAVMDAKTAEDFFNIALQECKTDAEKADLVLRTMKEQGLTQMAEGYRDLNDDIIKANEAQAKWDEATGKLGETLAPAAEAIKSFGADAIIWLTNRIEDAIQAAKNFWDLLTGEGEPASPGRRENRPSHRPARSADGSHAGGLRRVPYDGYLAETHKDEAILTAREAAVWRTLQRAAPVQRNPATSADVYNAAAATVNGLSTVTSVGPEHIEGVITLKTEDGQTLGRYIVPFVRREDKSNPQVVSDNL